MNGLNQINYSDLRPGDTACILRSALWQVLCGERTEVVEIPDDFHTRTEFHLIERPARECYRG